MFTRNRSKLTLALLALAGYTTLLSTSLHAASFQRLGYLPGGSFFFSEAYSVSADGSVVVGVSGNEAFIWDSANGMRSLQTVLTSDFGLDLAGWHLRGATGISADGQTIVGYGNNPSGNNEA